MFKVAALYKFSQIDNPLEVQIYLKKILKNLSIYGTILVGNEGINGTIASRDKKNLNKALMYLKNLKGFKDLDIKFSNSKKKPFIRLKIKLKQEIVTIGDKSIDPTKNVGEYVNPEDWNSLLEEENILLIDTRNDYEYSIGSFKNSINPKTQKFRDFPEWLKGQNFTQEDKNSKKVAMFCTGGIRCEMASSLMKNEGFKKVYHLKGGILKYFESVSFAVPDRLGDQDFPTHQHPGCAEQTCTLKNSFPTACFDLKAHCEETGWVFHIKSDSPTLSL